MISNPYIAYLINFIVFASVPIPILLCLKTKVAPVFGKIYDIVVAITGINIAIQLSLHFMKIKDLRQMLLFSHILLSMSLILIIVSIFKTPLSYYRYKRYLIYSILPIIIGAAADAVNHYMILTADGSNTFYLQLGVLCFLIIHAIYLLQNILNTYKENIQSEFYKTLAYKDGLTGVYNRSAFNKEIESINLHKDKFSMLTCICIDLNNLK